MADAVAKQPRVPVEAEKPAEDALEAPAAEAAPAENGTADEAYEPPKKRGRPSGGAVSKRTPKKVKVPQLPTRRSARRSASRSSEASTPTEKKEEPIGAAVVAEKENVDSANTTEKKEEVEETKKGEKSEESAVEKKADNIEPAKPVEAEA